MEPCSCCERPTALTHPVCRGFLEIARIQTGVQQQGTSTQSGTRHNPADGIEKNAGLEKLMCKSCDYIIHFTPGKDVVCCPGCLEKYTKVYQRNRADKRPAVNMMPLPTKTQKYDDNKKAAQIVSHDSWSPPVCTPSHPAPVSTPSHQTPASTPSHPTPIGLIRQPKAGCIRTCGACGAIARETVVCDGGHSVCRECVEPHLDLATKTKEKPTCPSMGCQSLIQSRVLASGFTRRSLDVVDSYLRDQFWESAKEMVALLDEGDFWCTCEVLPKRKRDTHVCRIPLTSASKLQDVSQSSEEFWVVKNYISSSGHWPEHVSMKLQRLFSYKPMRAYLEKVRSLKKLLEESRVSERLLLHPVKAENLDATIAEGLCLTRDTCREQPLGKGLYLTSLYGFPHYHEPDQRLLLCRVVSVEVENTSQRSPDKTDSPDLTIRPTVLCLQQASSIYPQYLVTFY